eukprot:11011203-Lingulodinium_polyedra.AAC.1
MHRPCTGHEAAMKRPGTGQEPASSFRSVRFSVWFDRFSLLSAVLDKPACRPHSSRYAVPR